MRHDFDDLGHLPLVWRCALLNDAPRQAAERYGFTFEGILRSSAIVKGWQRDQAWFSMLASEWPARESAIAAWLDKANFDEAGRVKLKLARRGAPRTAGVSPALGDAGPSGREDAGERPAVLGIGGGLESVVPQEPAYRLQEFCH